MEPIPKLLLMCGYTLSIFEFVFDNNVNQSTCFRTLLATCCDIVIIFKILVLYPPHQIQKYLWHSSTDSFLSYRFLFFCFQSRSTSSPGSEENAEESKARRNPDGERWLILTLDRIAFLKGGSILGFPKRKRFHWVSECQQCERWKQDRVRKSELHTLVFIFSLQPAEPPSPHLWNGGNSSLHAARVFWVTKMRTSRGRCFFIQVNSTTKCYWKGASFLSFEIGEYFHCVPGILMFSFSSFFFFFNTNHLYRSFGTFSVFHLLYTRQKLKLHRASFLPAKHTR